MRHCSRCFYSDTLLEHSYWERQEEFLRWLVQATWHRYGRNIQQMVLCYFDAIRGCLWRLVKFLEMKIALKQPHGWPQNSPSQRRSEKDKFLSGLHSLFQKRSLRPKQKPQNTKKMPCHGGRDVATQQHLLFSSYAMKLGSHQRHLGCKKSNQWLSCHSFYNLNPFNTTHTVWQMLTFINP